MTAGTGSSLIDSAGRATIRTGNPLSDVEAGHARTLDQLDDLGPAARTAWATVYSRGRTVRPLDPGALTPVGEAMADPGDVLAWWSEHPDHAVGMVVGAGLFAVHGFTIAEYRAWIASVVVVETEVPTSDLEDRYDVRREAREIGMPSVYSWEPPPRPALRTLNLFGKAVRDGSLTAVLPRTLGDFGCHAVWTFDELAAGRPPTPVRRRKLAAGVTLLATGDTVPIWATRADGATLTERTGHHPAPLWLVDLLEGRR